MRSEWLAVLALGACASTAETPFSADDLVADAPGYVAARYQPSALPAALIADLTAADFQCQHSTTASECGRSRPAFGSCFDVVTVRITASAVSAEQNRRCMGVRP